MTLETALIPGGNVASELTETWWKTPESPFGPFMSYVVRKCGSDWQGVIRLYYRYVATPELSITAVGLGGVYVRPDMRNQGLGLAMLIRCLNEIGQYGDIAVLYANASHARLYLNAGFLKVEEPGLWMKALRRGIAVHTGHCTWRVMPEGKF